MLKKFTFYFAILWLTVFTLSVEANIPDSSNLVSVGDNSGATESEQEPNDTREQANLLGSDVVFFGAIGDRGRDTDFLAIGVNSSGSVNLSLTATNNDADILRYSLFDSEGTEIESGYNVAYGQINELVINAAYPQAYFLRLYDIGYALYDVPDVDYEITTTAYDSSPVFIVTIDVTEGGTTDNLGSRFVVRDAADFIAMFYPDDGFLLQGVETSCSGELSGNAFTFSEFSANCDLLGVFVLAPPPDDDGDGVPNDEDAFPNDPSETTDADADGTGDNADEDDDNDGVSDELETQYGTDPLNASDYPVTLETESNGDIETADALTIGIPMVGSLYSYEDIDVFEFSVDEAIDLTVNIRKPSDSDSVRYIVVDSDPNLLAGGRLAFPRSETKTVGIVEPGIYFVAVGGNGLLDTSTDEYEIRLTAAPFSGSFEVEPNNNDLMAKGLSNGVPIYGHLANEDDVDVFTFEVTWEAVLDLKIDKLTDDFDRIRYLVRDENGTSLAAGDLFSLDTATKRIGLAGVGDYFIEIYNTDLLSVSLEEYRITASWTESPNADADGDGVTDSEDNCPNQSNVNQSDYDGDGAGDSCDSDDDNDTVPDLQDAFPLDASESTDTDGDGVGNNADTDDDGDGYSDSAEILAETDPLNAASYPESAEDETSGLPIWLYYIATQREAAPKPTP